MLKFEPIIPDDLNEIRGLQPPDWTDIIPSFRFYIDSGFSNPVKVVLEGKTVGVGVSISFPYTTWLAHIIVDPEFRNHGIGSAIVDHLLADSELQEYSSVLLIATKIGEPVYFKKGFRGVGEYVFLKRHDPWVELPLSRHIQPFSIKYMPLLTGMDLFVSGEDRSRLLSKYLNEALVFLDHGQPDGFYLPGLGEGLILADTKQAGIELMKVKHGRADKAVLPMENLTGISFLKEHGFIETLRAKRMVLGPDIPWHPERIYARIGGNLG